MEERKREEIIEKCVKCERIEKITKVVNGLPPGEYCSKYAYPSSKWRMGNCPMATHIIQEIKPEPKKRVGQQKQKKHK